MAEPTRNSSGFCVTIASSTATVEINATAVTGTVVFTTSVIVVAAILSCTVDDVAVTAMGRSSLVARVVARGGVTNTSGALVGNNVTANGVYLSGSPELANIVLSLGAGTIVTVEARCSQACGRALGGYYLSHGVYISAQVSVRNTSFTAINASFDIEAPKYSVILKVANTEYLDRAYINITSSNAKLHTKGQHVGDAGRFGAFVHSSASKINDAYLMLDKVHGVATAESGGCNGAATVLVMLYGDTVSSSIIINNSSLVAAVVNGTVSSSSPFPGFVVGVLTLLTALVSIGPPTGAATATNVTIDIAHSTV